MSDHRCPLCEWTPADDAEYPEDRLIDHYEDEHCNRPQ